MAMQRTRPEDSASDSAKRLRQLDSVNTAAAQASATITSMRCVWRLLRGG
jgi:hypothetical protein